MCTVEVMIHLAYLNELLLQATTDPFFSHYKNIFLESNVDLAEDETLIASGE